MVLLTLDELAHASVVSWRLEGSSAALPICAGQSQMFEGQLTLGWSMLALAETTEILSTCLSSSKRLAWAGSRGE